MIQIKHLKFATYALINTFHGIIAMSFGPIIPYFTKVTHQDQTYFSFIFFVKAIGFLIGSWLVKMLEKHINYHQLLLIAILVCGSALIISSLDLGFINLGITMFMAGVSCYILQVMCNICVLEVFIDDHQDYWFQAFGIFFSIGGLIGPMVVFYTEELALRAIGISLFLCLAPIFLLKSPERKEEDSQIVEKNTRIQLPLSAQVGLCLTMFIYIGLQNIYPNWGPTYIVKSGIYNKQTGDRLISLYWIINILAKIIQLFIKDTIENRMFFLLKCQLIFAFITIVLQWFELFAVLCYFGNITTSFFLSAVYAQIYTIAQEHGYEFAASTTANLTMCACLGEGLLVAPIGYAMGIFGYKAFIYAVFIVSVLLLAIFVWTNRLMAKVQQEIQDFLQIQS